MSKLQGALGQRAHSAPYQNRTRPSLGYLDKRSLLEDNRRLPKTKSRPLNLRGRLESGELSASVGLLPSSAALLTGRVVLEPIDVLVVWHRNTERQRYALFDRRRRARIDPLMNFRVTVRE